MLWLLRRPVILAVGIALLSAAQPPSAPAALGTPFAILSGKKNIIVWQRFETYLMVTEDLTAGRDCYLYDYGRMTISDLTKAPRPGTWTPIGYDARWLMYVDNHQSLDRLMAHCIDYGVGDPADLPVDLSVYKQIPCGMLGQLKCFFGEYRGQKVGDHYPVDIYVHNQVSGTVSLHYASDTEKSQFAHDGVRMVYCAYTSPTDVSIYGISMSGGPEYEIAAVAGTGPSNLPQAGYWPEPSVSGDLVAWAEKSGTTYTIKAKNTSTGEVRTIATTTANPPRPEAGRGSIFWQVAGGATGLDIHGYDWDLAQQFAVTSASGDQTKLRVCDDLVTWTTGFTSSQTLWGANILPPVRVTDLRVSLVTPESVQLAWTSAGTAQNPPVAYDLRTRTDGPITDANWSTSAQVPGLPTPQAPGTAETFSVGSLSPGHHYFAIKEQLSGGQYSVLSDCVCAYISDESAAFVANDGAYISYTGIVTGVSSNVFYCERPTRTGAIKATLRSGEAAPSVGQPVAVTGKLGQDPVYCGPVLTEAATTPAGTGSVTPVAVTPSRLGGSDPRFGGTPDPGLSSMWMLVRTWGQVWGLTTGTGCSFYLQDGWPLPDNNSQGVLVTSPFPAPVGLADGSFVSVDGICRVSRTQGRQIEIVRNNTIRVWPSQD